MNRHPIRCSILAASLISSAAFAGDWAVFRGPNNDGTVPAPEGVGDWKKVSLSNRWKAETNAGFSSFAIAGGRAYTLVTGEADGNVGEMLVCLGAEDGKELWRKPLTVIAKYDGGGDSGTPDNKGGDGPRSTPVINGGKAYVIDSNLGVFCFDAESGKEVWKRDVLKDNAGVQIKWHNAASPLIDGDVLLMCGGGAGQALLGLNKNTGEVIWKGEDDRMTHATPIIANLLGVKQCIFFTQKGLVSVAPADGTVLWRQDYPFKVSTAASPVVWEDIVYCSAGYGVGAGAFKVSKEGGKFTLAPLWRTEGDSHANHWSTPVVRDGYLYGMFSFKQYGQGPLACVDIRTGEMKWKQDGFGPGQVILSGNAVVATSDQGEIVVAAAKPGQYAELLRKDVLDGKVWSYPAIAGGRLFARSTKEAVCLQLN